MDKKNLQTVYLKDYKKPSHEVSELLLNIELEDNYTVVTNSSKWKCLDSIGSLTLHGEELELLSLNINGKEHSDYVVENELLTINSLPQEFHMEIKTKIFPSQNKSLMGLYKSGDMYCTQCEAEGFRKITYYLDRPDVMSLFTTKIIADRRKYPVLLSNGNLIDSGYIEGGKHYATWEDPFRKPCYLFAMVAGDLICVEDNFITMSGRVVKLKIFVERENLEKTSHAMEALKKSMAWDEKAYGREYDLDMYMIVAVNDFNMGAMENKGLNIFNSKYVLADPNTATDIDFANVDRVIGHEYFHNWSGNRVTCRDWFQLSLKEGFTVYREQQFVEDITESPVSRIEQVKLLRQRQFSEDAGPMAHPVRPESFVEINNFYTVTIYEKGSEVIRMMANLLGRDMFRKACDEYFNRFDGMAVTTDDFVKVMQEVSGVDLEQFKLWYSQAGTPKIKLDGKYFADKEEYVLNVEQSVPDTPGQKDKLPMHIPLALGLVSDKGEAIPVDIQGYEVDNTVMYNLRERNDRIVCKNVRGEPIPSILRGFSGAVSVDFDYTDKQLLSLMNGDEDAFNRWDASQVLFSRKLMQAVNDPNSADIIFSDNEMHEVIKSVISDKTIAPSFKAELLQLPSLDEVINSNNKVDPVALKANRDKLLRTIAVNHEVLLLELYNELLDSCSGRYKYNNKDSELRSLKKVCLGLLGCIGDGKHIELLTKQYESSDNMTDQYSALCALTNIDCPERDLYLESFYNKWQHEPLVVNKWLVLNSMSGLNLTFDKVKEIKSSVRFKITNPNMVYSLIGGFCGANLGQFHRHDIAAYQFLVDVVLELDKINPQVAARMVQPFTRFKQYSDDCRDRMLVHLKKLASHNLCKDVAEIVEKSLANG